MAWLQTDTSGNYPINFRFGGTKFKRSLKTKSERDAKTRLSRLEENMRLVESGRLLVPDQSDIAVLLLSDGKLDKKLKATKEKQLAELFDAYFDALPDGALENTTLQSIQIHRRHLERHLGVRFKIQQVHQNDLQCYIAKRSKEKGIRGRTLSATTIRKEIATLCSVWNWGVMAQQVTGAFPNKGLMYPKVTEKPRFHTWDEIETKIAAGCLTEEEQRDLWDCLFLSQQETDELLEYVRVNARHPFVYPMFVMAAHTGARRSELMRSELTDIGEGFVTIREKKRVRGQNSTRRVPVSTKLASVIEGWKQNHPGGNHAFCKSKLDGPREITAEDANEQFRQALVGSKWEVIRGWHCLRHSFCSNCAMRGVDQRILDSWVGHTTESMRRRYRHLFPNQETAVLKTVFG